MHLERLEHQAHSGASSFALGILLGAAVGAILGLAFAPRAGHETRRQVQESAERLRRKATATYDGASHSLSDVVSRTRDAFAAGREALHSARASSGRAAVDVSVS